MGESTMFNQHTKLIYPLILLQTSLILLLLYIRPINWGFKQILRVSKDATMAEADISETVVKFESSYLAKEYRQNDSSFVYILEGYNQGGFGVVFLYMHQCAYVADEANVPFHVLVKPTYHYNYFFSLTTDYTEQSESPIFMHYSNRRQRRMYPNLPWDNNFKLMTNLSQLGSEHFFTLAITQNFELLTDYNYNKNGKTDNQVYRKLQVIAQSMWKLNGLMQEQIKVLRTLMFGPNETFIAVHIRGGYDKIGREMDYIPVCEYVKRVTSLRNKFPENTTVSVFIFSNDYDLAVEFKRQLMSTSGSQWNVVGWGDGIDLLEKIQPLLERRLIPKELNFPTIKAIHRKIHNLLIEKGPVENSYHTHELVSSLSIASYSSYLVCSMNSNLCKLAAMLRQGDLRTFVAVDNAYWMPIFRPIVGFKANCTDNTRMKTWCDDVSPDHLNCKVLLPNGSLIADKP